MADINLNINILDSEGCPTLLLIDPTDLSITINGGSPILADNSITELVPQDTTVTIVVDKEGYDSYVNSIDVGTIDVSINILLSPTIPVDFINITQSCHSYIINNIGTTSDNNVTYSITDLDGNIIGDNIDIELNFNTSKTFTSEKDNVYLLIIKDQEDTVIRQYVIIDYCNVLQCISNRILEIICDCGCHETKDCDESNCKKDFELKRIFLLQYDLFNRINKEYRLNSYYTVIDDIKVNDLKTAQELIDKLNSYCSTCGDNNIVNSTTILNITSNTTYNSGCGCS